MTALSQTLRQYLERTGLPVYAAEDAPPGTGRPLVTYRLTGSAPGRAACEVCWHGPGRAAEAAAHLAALMDLFPGRGVLIMGGACCLALPGAWRCGRDSADPRACTAALQVEVTLLDARGLSD